MLARTPPWAAGLAWTDALETGIDDVDQQHRRLLEIFNRVATTRASAALAAALRELTDYSLYHFTNEADLMRQWPVRAEHRRAHLRAHQRFCNFLQRAASLVEVEPQAVGDELTGFLAQWLQHHIMGMDRRMADAIHALRQGRPVAEASQADALDVALDGLGERTFDLLEANHRLRQEAVRRQQLELTLRDSEARYRDLFMHAPDALFVIDAQRRIALVNQAGLRLLGAADAGALEGQPIARFVRELREPMPFETVAKGVDGTSRPVELLSGPPDARGDCHLIVRDISERRRLQRRASEAARLEQERLGRELHGGTGQHLVGIGLMASLLQRRLERPRRRPEADLAAELGRHVAEALDDVRRLAHGLAPLPLACDGLVGALQGLCADLGCHYAWEGDAHPIDEEVALQLYRIAQESLSNALRHSGARRIELRLRDDGEQLSLRVRDDGRGLGAAGHEGLGLSSMHYRAGLIGAQLSFDEPPGGGTEVICCWRRTG